MSQMSWSMSLISVSPKIGHHSLVRSSLGPWIDYIKLHYRKSDDDKFTCLMVIFLASYHMIKKNRGISSVITSNQRWCWISSSPAALCSALPQVAGSCIFVVSPDKWQKNIIACSSAIPTFLLKGRGRPELISADTGQDVGRWFLVDHRADGHEMYNRTTTVKRAIQRLQCMSLDCGKPEHPGKTHTGTESCLTDSNPESSCCEPTVPLHDCAVS